MRIGYELRLSGDSEPSPLSLGAALGHLPATTNRTTQRKKLGRRRAQRMAQPARTRRHSGQPRHEAEAAALG